jgi:hypothetical protein
VRSTIIPRVIYKFTLPVSEDDENSIRRVTQIENELVDLQTMNTHVDGIRTIELWSNAVSILATMVLNSGEQMEYTKRLFGWSLIRQLMNFRRIFEDDENVDIPHDVVRLWRAPPRWRIMIIHIVVTYGNDTG